MFFLYIWGGLDYVCEDMTSEQLVKYVKSDYNPWSEFFVQLGLDFKLNTKIGLDTTHPPTTHHKLLGHFQAY